MNTAMNGADADGDQQSSEEILRFEEMRKRVLGAKNGSLCESLAYCPLLFEGKFVRSRTSSCTPNEANSEETAGNLYQSATWKGIVRAPSSIPNTQVEDIDTSASITRNNTGKCTSDISFSTAGARQESGVEGASAPAAQRATTGIPASGARRETDKQESLVERRKRLLGAKQGTFAERGFGAVSAVRGMALVDQACSSGESMCIVGLPLPLGKGEGEYSSYSASPESGYDESTELMVSKWERMSIPGGESPACQDYEPYYNSHPVPSSSGMQPRRQDAAVISKNRSGKGVVSAQKQHSLPAGAQWVDTPAAAAAAYPRTVSAPTCPSSFRMEEDCQRCGGAPMAYNAVNYNRPCGSIGQSPLAPYGTGEVSTLGYQAKSVSWTEEPRVVHPDVNKFKQPPRAVQSALEATSSTPYGKTPSPIKSTSFNAAGSKSEHRATGRTAHSSRLAKAAAAARERSAYMSSPQHHLDRSTSVDNERKPHGGWAQCANGTFRKGASSSLNTPPRGNKHINNNYGVH